MGQEPTEDGAGEGKGLLNVLEKEEGEGLCPLKDLEKGVGRLGG